MNTTHTRQAVPPEATASENPVRLDRDRFGMNRLRRFAGRLPRQMTPGTASHVPEAPSGLDAERRRWERAADAGDSDAMFELGLLYANSMQPPDLDAARRWWERAADAGNSDAMFNLGHLYAN